MIRQVATIHAVRALTTYQLHSPLPPDWFSVRFFPKSSKPNKPSSRTRTNNNSPPGREEAEEESNNLLHLRDGDVLAYTLSNRTHLRTAHVHMLSLNASWTVGTLLWNVRLPPRGQRTGELTVVLPRRVNADDPAEAEDMIVVIFCVGSQGGCCGERLVTPAEWVRGVYVPPVLLGMEGWELGRGGGEGGGVTGVESGRGNGDGSRSGRVSAPAGAAAWLGFVPPPNWIVKSFGVCVGPRVREGDMEVGGDDG